jgi:hypothetical protein
MLGDDRKTDHDDNLLSAEDRSALDNLSKKTNDPTSRHAAFSPVVDSKG